MRHPPEVQIYKYHDSDEYKHKRKNNFDDRNRHCDDILESETFQILLYSVLFFLFALQFFPELIRTDTVLADFLNVFINLLFVYEKHSLLFAGPFFSTFHRIMAADEMAAFNLDIRRNFL